MSTGKKKVKLTANGVATAQFKKVTKPGKYRLVVTYGGSPTVKASSVSTSVKVRR